MKKRVIQALEHGLIVSCQALDDEPLHSSFIMSRMAKAACQSGAVGIRANSVVDIQAIKDAVDLPLIGIIKRDYTDSEVYITPTIKEVRAVCEIGAEIVALDGTNRKRPRGEDLKLIIEMARQSYPNQLFMSDTATIEDVKKAKTLGFNFVGTTLYGYTKETMGRNIADNDFEYLRKVIEVSELPVIAEGKIDTPEKAQRVLELGCFCVVCGGAITRPQEITKKFIQAIDNFKQNF